MSITEAEYQALIQEDMAVEENSGSRITVITPTSAEATGNNANGNKTIAGTTAAATTTAKTAATTTTTAAAAEKQIKTKSIPEERKRERTREREKERERGSQHLLLQLIFFF